MNKRRIVAIGLAALAAVTGGKFLWDHQPETATDVPAPIAAEIPYPPRPDGPIKFIQAGFPDDVKKEFRGINAVTSVFDLSALSINDADTVAIMLSSWDAIENEAPASLRASIRQQVAKADVGQQVVFFTLSSKQDDKKWPILVFNQSAFDTEGVSTLCRAMIVHDLAFFWDGSPGSTTSFPQSNARLCVEQSWTALPNTLQVVN